MPRVEFGIATIGNQVYVHGGINSTGRLNDFLMLDMSDKNCLSWTVIHDSGFTKGICSHTLSPISATRLLLVGGQSSDKISNKVRSFDVQTSEWQDEEPLPAEFGGSGGGLSCHSAVALQNGNRAMVICLGGYVDRSRKKHPNHIGVFGTFGQVTPVQRPDVKPNLNLLANDDDL